MYWKYKVNWTRGYYSRAVFVVFIVDLLCLEISKGCSNPPPLPNGYFNRSGNSATYYCNQGFYWSGNNTIFCLWGSWSRRKFQCIKQNPRYTKTGNDTVTANYIIRRRNFVTDQINQTTGETYSTDSDPTLRTQPEMFISQTYNPVIMIIAAGITLCIVVCGGWIILIREQYRGVKQALHTLEVSMSNEQSSQYGDDRWIYDEIADTEL